MSHLMYADDLVIYAKANELEAFEVRQILQLYCDCTGQEINWAISSVHFSHNVTRMQRGTLCRILAMQECNHKRMYLGQPFCQFKAKSVAFSGILDKLSKKLTGWK